MFSPALEVVLNIAFREAVSRRHAYLTLEHLLYAPAHVTDGERILKACGADMHGLRRSPGAYLDSSVERLRSGVEQEPEQTLAFRRVLQTAILHGKSAQRDEANAGDIPAAILQQPKSHAAQLLADEGITRLDVLNYISHGITKTPLVAPGVPAPGGETVHQDPDSPPASSDPLSAYCINLTERARQGLLDPLIGRTLELQRTIEVLCRRRKNNPVFVGDPGVGKTALAEGLATRLLKDDVQGALSDAAKLAARHLRDYRLPDSAIDLLDEAGAVTRLAALAALATSPNETPTEAPTVDAREIEKVAARAARIPDRQASSSDRERLRTLEESLQRVVFGQEEAVGLVAQAIKRSRAGLAQPERPAGCFLFTGPTGVGKTELGKQLASQLGNEFVRFDMSEYMEKHAVARLIGAPPGYVGFERGGLLVDAVRTHPYSVVLFDEIEKAHPDIYNVLLQVMDHATLTDNAGRKADFRNTVLILTSNAGSREMSASSIRFR